MLIAGEDVAWRFGWRIVEHETKSVNVANNEPMVIMGAMYVTLLVGGLGKKEAEAWSPKFSLHQTEVDSYSGLIG